MCRKCVIDTNKWLISIGREDMIVVLSEQDNIFTPFDDCGWKDQSDGTCSHPQNTTPECSQFICPISSNIT